MAKNKKNWIEYAKTPEEVGVSSKEIQAFIDECIEKGRELHSMTVIRHGKIACEIYRDPFTPEHRHMMYSVSKSFTSTAIIWSNTSSTTTAPKTTTLRAFAATRATFVATPPWRVLL